MSITESVFASDNKPEVFIKSITFNDDTTLTLSKGSILVFTGANNSGKSQVLKDVFSSFNESKSNKKLISNIFFDFIGEIGESFWNSNFFATADGNITTYSRTHNYYEKETVLQQWNTHKLPYDLHKLFIKLIDTEQRLTTSNALRRSEFPEKHPIYKLTKNQKLSQAISDYFRKAFNSDLVLDYNAISTIPLRVGNAPDGTSFTFAQRDEFTKEVENLELLEQQGDGMRSFASILLDTFTSEHTITLIDEPEAFLHPPQARLLGKMLVNNNPTNRQLLISTHSEDFLQGLLDSKNSNVTVIHINRVNNINHMSILENSSIKNLWGNPILRYSYILSGLFHDKVIVCESDYDCLFYQAMINAIYEEAGSTVPDVFFTHCGGKNRMKYVVSSLSALKVPVVAIPDFDIINKKAEFKPLVESFNMSWADLDMESIYDWLNSNTRAKEDIKRMGKNALDNIAAEKYSLVEARCRLAGLFIVPCGEMECFVKNRFSKAEWVYDILENKNLATDVCLKDAREFIQSVIDFKPCI